jgi:hypothetical protein
VEPEFILFNPGRNSEESDEFAIKLIFFCRQRRQIGSQPSAPLAAMLFGDSRYGQLARRGIKFEALDNGLLRCADPAAAQRIAERG